jgi:hypothetical protein
MGLSVQLSLILIKKNIIQKTIDRFGSPGKDKWTPTIFTFNKNHFEIFEEIGCIVI